MADIGLCIRNHAARGENKECRSRVEPQTNVHPIHSAYGMGSAILGTMMKAKESCRKDDRHDFINHSTYVAELRLFLPEDAFKPDPQSLFIALIHLGIIAGCLMLGIHTNALFVNLVLGTIAGHSLVCLSFYAHYLSHNVVVRSPGIRYGLELFFWGINGMPTTIWRQLHNKTHHPQPNTSLDPDRRFLEPERNIFTRLFTFIFHPNKEVPNWNPLVGLHLIAYIIKNTMAALYYPGKSKPDIVPNKPQYTKSQRVLVAFEVMVIYLIQYGYYVVLDYDLVKYICFGPYALLVASISAIAYILTNHFPNEVHGHTDMLKASTSVIIAPIFDHLHLNFSYHSEHHLFPSIRADSTYKCKTEAVHHFFGRSIF
ncbi:MAG: hypothetical protein GKR87_01885 [Kiritimatiellae bacterium]|nr:hypothetical protein [Kiritimatiellia bacterium]